LQNNIAAFTIKSSEGNWVFLGDRSGKVGGNNFEIGFFIFLSGLIALANVVCSVFRLLIRFTPYIFPNQSTDLIPFSTEIGKRKVVTILHTLSFVIDLEIEIFGVPWLGAVAVGVPFDYSPGSLRVGERGEEECGG